MLLYKYRPAMGSSDTDNTRRIFSTSSLYYAKASTFNDPFDAQVNIEATSTKEEAIDRHWLVLRERARGRGGFTGAVLETFNNARTNINKIYEDVKNEKYIDHERYYRELVDTLGMVALAEDRDNLLLWAHYSNNHYGMCLGFEWDETGLPPAEEVIYQNRYRKLEYYSHTEEEVAAISLLQKSADWAYEREWRSVAKPVAEYVRAFRPNQGYYKELEEIKKNGNDITGFLENNLRERNTYLERRVKVEGSGAKAFNKSSLVEVVFGLRMSEADVQSHMQTILGYGFKPKFFKAQKNPHRYKLDMQEI